MKHLKVFVILIAFIAMLCVASLANAQGPAPHYSGGVYGGGPAPHYSGAGVGSVGVVPRNYGGRFASRYYGGGPGPIPHYSGGWGGGPVPHYSGGGGYYGSPYLNLNLYGNRVGGSVGIGGFYFHF